MKTFIIIALVILGVILLTVGILMWLAVKYIKAAISFRRYCSGVAKCSQK